MSTTGWVVVACVLIAAIAFLVLGKRLGWFSMRLFGARLSGGSAKRGSTIEKAVSRKGSISAVDTTGTSASIQQADAHGDIRAEVSERTDPKP